MAATHALRTALRSSKPAFGAWITLPGTFNARAVALSSPHLSWVVIDCEHGLTPLHPGAAESISAVVSTGDNAPSVLVRVPATGASSMCIISIVRVSNVISIMGLSGNGLAD